MRQFAHSTIVGVNARDHAWEAYLYDHTEDIEHWKHNTRPNDLAVLLSTAADADTREAAALDARRLAAYQCDRLHSGLYAATTHDTYDDARLFLTNNGYSRFA